MIELNLNSFDYLILVLTIHSIFYIIVQVNKLLKSLTYKKNYFFFVFKFTINSIEENKNILLNYLKLI